MDSKNLREIVKEIQHRKGWTIEQVAKSIGYSRVHLNKEMNKGNNEVLANVLIGKFSPILQNVTYKAQSVPDENTPTSDLQAVAGAKSYSLDKYIMLLEDSLKEKKDQLKEVQARLTDLEGRQRDFLAKVENSIERYEHLVLTQLQNGKVKEPEDSTPIVHERSYKSQGKKL